jgi:hypothetical protein
MKNWIILLLTVVGFGSFALAQQFTLPQPTVQQFIMQPFTFKVGAALTFGTEVFFGADLGIRTPNLLTFSKTIGVAVHADVIANFASVLTGFGTLSPVLNINLDKNALVYLGPTVGLSFGGSNSILLLGADLGFSYAISPFFGIYGDSKFIVFPIFVATFDAGATYNLSQELSVYLEFQGGITPVGFNPGIGLGLFIHL